MDAHVSAALERLLTIAEGGTGQSRRCANFLLAWWNAGDCGGFDFTDMWNVDQRVADDMVVVFAQVSRLNEYPDKDLYGARFEDLVRQWRPELVKSGHDLMAHNDG
ncbi:hypothetical protein SAMN06297251_108157 [Fulvimarina manganoxydans]|uniref:DUF7673 domain-containing protein n=1 Tax=Fulvimarina manganoxydans TaxID=937218 RepID=A0A1W2C4E5_9HYPH|nr:hypothetical protein [Fulvimarina manganoxydans]MCK5931716.1 hypothetical protein [Fulvimarina manganoxydans]SMC80069.1 hypothetical protein SAMN06297251_108157 [Fulvimarina manganoxydans]